MGLKWEARKNLWCGLPWTFTVYSFDEDRFYIKKGVLTQVIDEVRLYRILDLSVTRTLGQRMFGLGTIHVHSSDKTQGTFDIVNIRDVMTVKEILSQLVEDARDRKRVSSRELMGDGGEHFDGDSFDDDIDR